MRNMKAFSSPLVVPSDCALGLALLVGFLLAASPSVIAQQQKRTAAAERRPGARSYANANDGYRIGPGDVLEIRVYKLAELSREALRVEENGNIRMPLISDAIPAACQTESELASNIASRYLTYMRNPQVDVFVKEYNSKPVAVIGAVNTPGRFQLQRQIRLLDLLSYAGGPAERAGGNVQLVHSSSPFRCASGPAGAGNSIGVDFFNLNDTLRGDVRANPYVRAGDIVTVLESPQVHVVGNVLRPTSLALKERITISQAIAMAGGTLPDTQADRIRIVRQNRNNTTQEILVDLKAVAKRQAKDVELQPNDIVEVPVAGARRFMRRLLGDVVPSVARLPTYVVR
ncbi:MAG: polysaccharide biosynthesis/export family protein [Acidobacteriota bacterium]